MGKYMERMWQRLSPYLDVLFNDRLRAAQKCEVTRMIPICEPWCWYIYRHKLGDFGQGPMDRCAYSSTMVRICDVEIHPAAQKDFWPSRPGKRLQNKLHHFHWENYGTLPFWVNYGKSPFWMGKLTISMAIFNSKLLVTRGYHWSNFSKKQSALQWSRYVKVMGCDPIIASFTNIQSTNMIKGVVPPPKAAELQSRGWGKGRILDCGPPQELLHGCHKVSHSKMWIYTMNNINHAKQHVEQGKHISRYDLS